MNTPAHLIFGVMAFGKPNAPARNAAVLIGALLPDFSLYFMVFWNRFVRDMSMDEIFSRAYFSPYWQQVFAIDNSIPLWSLGLVAALYFKREVLTAFFAAGLLHLCLDLPLHHDDGRAHFWPFSDWKFESPLSYWDPDHYGHFIGPIEAVICLFFIYLLWGKFTHLLGRVLLVLAGLLECVPAFVFPVLFG